jgi:hypothetical protein
MSLERTTTELTDTNLAILSFFPAQPQELSDSLAEGVKQTNSSLISGELRNQVEQSLLLASESIKRCRKNAVGTS